MAEKNVQCPNVQTAGMPIDGIIDRKGSIMEYLPLLQTLDPWMILVLALGYLGYRAWKNWLDKTNCPEDQEQDSEGLGE